MFPSDAKMAQNSHQTRSFIAIGTICVVRGLIKHPEKNGLRVKVIGPPIHSPISAQGELTAKEETRYLVIALKNNGKASIKKQNLYPLKQFQNLSKYYTKSLENLENKMNGRAHINANYNSNSYAIYKQLSSDLKNIFNKECFYLSHLICNENDFTLFNRLKHDILTYHDAQSKQLHIDNNISKSKSNGNYNYNSVNIINNRNNNRQPFCTNMRAYESKQPQTGDNRSMHRSDCSVSDNTENKNKNRNRKPNFNGETMRLTARKLRMNADKIDQLKRGWNEQDFYKASMQCYDERIVYENPKFSLIFTEIVSTLCDHFNVELITCLMNYYKDNYKHWSKYHYDKYKYKHDKIGNNINYNNKKHSDIIPDITIGASFGITRTLSFLHVLSNESFDIKQKNGDVFAFTQNVNNIFKHGVPKMVQNKINTTKKQYRVKGTSNDEGRISIIIWGKRK